MMPTESRAIRALMDTGIGNIDFNNAHLTW